MFSGINIEMKLWIFFTQDMRLGVVHHLCGEHFWAESQCSHGPMSVKEPKVPLKGQMMQ